MTYFCASQDNNRVKIQPTKMGEIFTNHISDKVLIPRISMEFFRTQQQNPIKKWTKDLNIVGISNNMKRCSLLIIMEMQIKTTVRCCFTCSRIAIFQKTENNMLVRM